MVSYFHPFASGAEGQALAQGLELARRGHVVHVVTRAVPGYPVHDEDYHGVFIHRWIKTAKAGPLFGLSFLSGVMAALRHLRTEIDVIHTHQGLWEAVATGLSRPLPVGRPTLVQPASAGYYGEADELRRTRGSGLLRRAILANTGFAAISSRDRAAVARARGRSRGSSGWPAGSMPGGSTPGLSSVEDSCSRAPRDLHGPAPSSEEHPAPARGLDGGRQAVAGQPDPGRAGKRSPEARRAGRVARDRRPGPVHRRVDDTSEYLRAGDLFVLPSVAEGMSNSLLEAMATALPCVVSGIAGNTDLIDDGRTGRLVAEPTAAAWSRVLMELIENPAEARRLGDAARLRIDEEFALPVVVDRYVELYRRMIAGTWPEA